MKISVVIPAYNAAGFVSEALESAATQTVPVHEIVVVDDGSSDATRELVRDWIGAHRVKVTLHAQDNAGVSVARNTAMELATGDWVALLDADDVWLPNHIKDLIVAAQCYPQAPTVFGDTVHFNQEGEVFPPFSRDKSLKCAIEHKGDCYLLDAEAFFAGTVPGLFLCPSASMVKRSTALAIGGFDVSIRYIEDRDFFLRMALQGPVAFMDRSISRNRIHDSNITHPRNAQRNAFYMIKLLRKMQDAADSCGLKESQVRLLQETHDRTVQSYLYGASVHGLRSYWHAVQALVGVGVSPASALDPRNLFRSLVCSVRPAPRMGA